MIIDVISYNGEVEIFDLRYNILKDFVDEFIVIEAPTTFSNKPKPLYFREHPLFGSPKISYYVIDENYTPEEIAQAYASPNTYGEEHWKREFMQKESIKKALVHLDDEDIVYISDCDEIWKPKEIGDGVYKLRQLVYTYHLNNRSGEPWAGTFVAKYKNIKNECLNHCRSTSEMRLNVPAHWKPNTHLDDGGWHFTGIGLDNLRRKLTDSYSVEDYNNPTVQARLEENFKNNVDWLAGWDRKFNYFTDESEWPQYAKDNKEKYIHLCKSS